MTDNDVIVLCDGATPEASVLYASASLDGIGLSNSGAGLVLPPDAESPAIRLLRFGADGPRPVDLDFANGLPIGVVLFDAEDRMIWFNETYRGVMGPRAHLLRIGDRFETIMTAAYRGGHAAGDADEIEDLIATRLARHRNFESFEEALSGGRRLLTEEIALANGGTLGVRTIL